MLRKSYPSAYARREKEVSEEEEDKSGKVSQKFDDLKYEVSDSVSYELQSDTLNNVMAKDRKCNTTTKFISETGTDVCMPQNGQTSYALQDRPNMEVLMSDLTCAICKQLLCRPVVLNCGDVYCEACIFNSSETTCPVCQSPHPNGFPNVCCFLEHFLERQFPKEYAARRESILEYLRPSIGSDKPYPTSTYINAYSSWFFGEGPTVHFAGCDYCGMCPIVGKRYRCKDCKEKMGVDLCEGCYNSSCKLPGRFNQQHTEDHQFEIVEITMAEAIYMIAAGNSSDDQRTLLRPEALNPQDIGSDQEPELEEAPNDGSEGTPLNIDCSEDEGHESRT